MAKRPGSAGDPLWYNDAIIYELHVRAFKDSNGDGIGDFPGLTRSWIIFRTWGSPVCGCSPSFRHLSKTMVMTFPTT